MTTLAVPGPPAPTPKEGALRYLWRDQWGRLAILAVATGTVGLATHYWTPALFLLALTARRRPGVRRRRNGAHRPQVRCVPLPARRARSTRSVVAAPVGIATPWAPEIARGVAPR